MGMMQRFKRLLFGQPLTVERTDFEGQDAKDAIAQSKVRSRLYEITRREAILCGLHEDILTSLPADQSAELFDRLTAQDPVLIELNRQQAIYKESIAAEERAFYDLLNKQIACQAKLTEGIASMGDE